MSDFISKTEVDLPDWYFDTNEDLRSHAKLLVGKASAKLLEQDTNPDRPEGTVLHSAITVPCHDDQNVTRQQVYLGYCAEACQDLGLVIRQSEIRYYEETEGKVAVLLVCTAEALDRAKAERGAEDNPDKSIRTH